MSSKLSINLNDLNFIHTNNLHSYFKFIINKNDSQNYIKLNLPIFISLYNQNENKFNEEKCDLCFLFTFFSFFYINKCENKLFLKLFENYIKLYSLNEIINKSFTVLFLTKKYFFENIIFSENEIKDLFYSLSNEYNNNSKKMISNIVFNFEKENNEDNIIEFNFLYLFLKSHILLNNKNQILGIFNFFEKNKNNIQVFFINKNKKKYFVNFTKLIVQIFDSILFFLKTDNNKNKDENINNIKILEMNTNDILNELNNYFKISIKVIEVIIDQKFYYFSVFIKKYIYIILEYIKRFFILYNLKKIFISNSNLFKFLNNIINFCEYTKDDNFIYDIISNIYEIYRMCDDIKTSEIFYNKLNNISINKKIEEKNLISFKIFNLNKFFSNKNLIENENIISTKIS